MIIFHIALEHSGKEAGIVQLLVVAYDQNKHIVVSSMSMSRPPGIPSGKVG
jgi:hypothetical protein